MLGNGARHANVVDVATKALDRVKGTNCEERRLPLVEHVVLLDRRGVGLVSLRVVEYRPALSAQDPGMHSLPRVSEWVLAVSGGGTRGCLAPGDILGRRASLHDDLGDGLADRRRATGSLWA